MNQLFIHVDSAISRQVVQLLNRQKRQSFTDFCRSRNISVTFKKSAVGPVVAEVGDQTLLENEKLAIGIVPYTARPRSAVLVGMLAGDPAISIIVDRKAWNIVSTRKIALVFAGAKQRDVAKQHGGNPSI